MKKLLTNLSFLVLIFYSNSVCQSGWFIISGVTSETLTTLNASGSLYWIVGNNGTIINTTDAGTTWTEFQSGVSVNLSGIHRPTSTQIWTAGDSGKVLVSTNAGSNWVQRNPGTLANFRDIFSRGSGVGYAIGDSGSCYYSSNTGQNWSYRRVPTSENLNVGIGPTSGTSLIALVGGNNGAIFKTTNAGMNWDTISSGTSNNIYGFGFGPAGRLFAVGANGTLLRSTNAGNDWSEISVPTLADLHSISSSGQNSNWLVACGSNGTIIKSTNAGDTWFLQSTPTTETLLSIKAPSNSIHVAVGTNGIILKTTDGGGNPVSVDEEEEILTEFSLYQNYPNPFNPSTKIVWQSPLGSWTTLKIYDLLGNEIATLIDEYKPIGKYEIDFDANELTSGIYFYKIQTENFVESKKMLLIK